MLIVFKKYYKLVIRLIENGGENCFLTYKKSVFLTEIVTTFQMKKTEIPRSVDLFFLSFPIPGLLFYNFLSN